MPRLCGGAQQNCESTQVFTSKLLAKEEMTVDYKILLKKYMRHVCDEEGSSFVGLVEYSDQFTAEERVELETMDAEILAENAALPPR